MPKPIENDSKYVRITVNPVIQRNPIIWNQKIKRHVNCYIYPSTCNCLQGTLLQAPGLPLNETSLKIKCHTSWWKSSWVFFLEERILMARTTLPALRRDKRWALCAKLPSLYLPPLDLVNKKYLPGNKDWTLWWLLLFIQTSNLIQSPPPSDISANLLGCDWLIMW